ncbi:MAG: hypothetical protein ACU85V_05145 [Gammaproteobacteria bacterium]
MSAPANGPDGATLDAWRTRIEALAAALGAAVAEANPDSERLAALGEEYAAVLEQPPSAPPTLLAEIYAASAELTATLAASAERQRDRVAADLREIGRGRKAVDAYR